MYSYSPVFPDWVSIYFCIEKDLENNTGTVVTFQMERGSWGEVEGTLFSYIFLKSFIITIILKSYYIPGMLSIIYPRSQVCKWQGWVQASWRQTVLLIRCGLTCYLSKNQTQTQSKCTSRFYLWPHWKLPPLCSHRSLNISAMNAILCPAMHINWPAKQITTSVSTLLV